MRINELEYCLSRLPDEARRHFAAQLGLKGKVSPAELEQTLMDPNYYAHALKQMDNQERKWLWFILFQSEFGKIKKQELYPPKNLSLSSVVFRQLMGKACRRGWIVGLRNRQLELVYYCPKEVRTGWAKALLREQSRQPLDEDAVTTLHANAFMVGQAFFHLLSSLSHEPWLLNKTGKIPQKELRKMDVELELEDIHLSWSGWTHFLLDVARSLQLIVETGKYARVNKTRWMSWLWQSWEDSISILYEAVCHVLLENHPRVEGYRLILEQLPTGKWYGIEQICRQVQILLGVRDSPGTVEELRDHWLIPMACMGWLEFGMTEAGEHCLKWLAYPPRSWEDPGNIPAYPESELEIYVPYHFPWNRRYELSQWADYMGGDYILVYEINERSLRRSFQYGWTIEKMTGRLEAWANGELPPVFSERLRDLWGRMDAVYLSTWTYLKQSGKADAEWAERLSETDWEIRKCSKSECFINATPSQIAAWLQARGKDVCLGERRLPAEEKIKSVNWAIDFQGLKDCRVETPDLGRTNNSLSLPKAWFSGPRRYGPEMTREVVRQSVAHQIPLLLVQDGQKLEVCPEDLCYEQGEWVFEAMVGNEQKKVKLARIQALQLLSPSSS
ncbi:hypothetical protein [Thermoactinomyces mirandus]|uniref:Helicase XPB/Ssl2 N-terminal domain-containing protein n=1 Tax=Thermoactinomyces mirandus TaxID=2756294 RepID=A0A7W2AQE1_9BACL|nr:hypothetical protein [Thermoactinomyces mirandus]MBA4601418.1 hypothetical protein [Thermoactinomyces mirandus]